MMNQKTDIKGVDEFKIMVNEFYENLVKRIAFAYL
jgi:hypothetical protein